MLKKVVLSIFLFLLVISVANSEVIKVDEAIGKIKIDTILLIQWELEKVLLLYNSGDPIELVDSTLPIIIRDVEFKMVTILKGYGLKEEKALKYVKKFTEEKSFINDVRNNIKKDIFFKKTRNTEKYLYLFSPIYRIFKNHLDTNKTNAYYYSAHFLRGVGLEEGGTYQIYNRIKHAIERAESPN